MRSSQYDVLFVPLYLKWHFLLKGIFAVLYAVVRTSSLEGEMSRVCFTSMEALVTRGQQYKVMNQLLHYGHREGYILNTPEKFSGDPDDSYEGATVIDAKALMCECVQRCTYECRTQSILCFLCRLRRWVYKRRYRLS